ncbi:MAG: hypothetical protein QM648_04310 [Solirubrobacterales bacterium]
MKLRIAVTASVVALAVAVSGCGGGGDQAFTTPTYPFSFDYPSGWTLTRGAKFNFGSDTSVRAVSVALQNPYDQVTITQYKLKKQIGAGENAYQPEVDRVVARLTKQAGGSASDAKVVKYGGLPGYQYVVEYPGTGNTTLQNKLTFLFRDKDEFMLNCQSTPKNREALNKGCDQILNSLKFE